MAARCKAVAFFEDGLTVGRPSAEGVRGPAGGAILLSTLGRVSANGSALELTTGRGA